MKTVILYTDGACSGNPGDGGWGCVLIYNGVEKELFGFEPATTNNRMELTAVIKGLEALKEKCRVQVYSDSAYIVNAFNDKWIDNWIKKNWKKGTTSEVKNIDLWEKLIELVNFHEASFIKVKGHSDNVYNNRCDWLAVNAIKRGY